MMAAFDTDMPRARSGFLSSFVQGVSRGFLSIAEANSRAREIDRLQALSDASLAARGLRREDIARHVFRDVFWG